MSPKLGEARLGEEELASSSDIELIDDDVEERAKEVIKSPFPTHEGTTWDHILDVILYEFRVEHAIAHDILENRYIDSATGEQLDMIGELWQVDRKMFESDDSLRARIKSMFPRHTSRATIDEIINALTLLLNCEPTDITIMDKFWHEPARFDVKIEQSVYDEAGVEIEELEQLLNDVAAAGVRPVLTIGAQFTHAGVILDEDGEPQYGEVILSPDEDESGEPYGKLYGGIYGGLAHEIEGHDPDKGYGSLDDPTLGGEYADLITRDLAFHGAFRGNTTKMRGQAYMIIHNYDFPGWTNAWTVDSPNEGDITAIPHLLRLRRNDLEMEALIDAPRIRRRNRSSEVAGTGMLSIRSTKWRDAFGGDIMASATLDAPRIRWRNRASDAAGVATIGANTGLDRDISASLEMYGWVNTTSADEINRGTDLTASATVDAFVRDENNRHAEVDATATIDAIATHVGYGAGYSDEYGAGG